MSKKTKKADTQKIAASALEFAVKYPVETIRGRYVPIDPQEVGEIPESYFPLMFCIYDSKMPLDPSIDYASRLEDMEDYSMRDTLLICVLPAVPLPPKNEIQRLMDDKAAVLREFSGSERVYATLAVGYNYAMQKVRDRLRDGAKDLSLAAFIPIGKFIDEHLSDIPLPK